MDFGSELEKVVKDLIANKFVYFIGYTFNNRSLTTFKFLLQIRDEIRLELKYANYQKEYDLQLGDWTVLTYNEKEKMLDRNFITEFNQELADSLYANLYRYLFMDNEDITNYIYGFSESCVHQYVDYFNQKFKEEKQNRVE